MRLARRRPGERKPAVDNIELHIGGLRAADLVERYGSPLLAICADQAEASARHQLKQLEQAAPTGSRLLLPYRDLPLPALLAPMHAAGIGAAVGNPVELALALRFNPGPGEIVVDGGAHSEALLRRVLPLQPFAVLVGEVAELQLLRALARELQLQVAVGLSLAPTGYPLGLEIEGGEAERACQYLFEHSQAFTLVSLHYPLAEGGPRPLPQLLEFLKLLQQRYRVDVPYLDIGCDPDFPAGLAERTGEAAAFCRSQELVQPKWILRPGAQLGSDLGTLLTRVESVRVRHSGQRFLITDTDTAIDGTDVQLATPDGDAGAPHAHYFASRDGAVGTEPALLPALRPGQLLALPGSAIHAMATPPPIVMVAQGSPRLISATGADATA
jgi:hypothetical protein